MKRRTKIILAIVVIIIGIGIYYLILSAQIATAYVAKIACSCTMVSHRPLESVLKEDLSNYSFIKTTQDPEDKSITASALGLVKRKAIFRKGLGCTLVVGVSEAAIRSQIDEKLLLEPTKSSHLLWPMGDSVSQGKMATNWDSLKLWQAVNDAYFERDSDNLKRTRAVIVIDKGKIIAEKYGEGITKDTPLLGWSMTKSVTNALVGILVAEKKLSVDNKGLMPEWSKDDDPRRNITLDQLLRMSSGLKFDEIYNVVSDATRMLFAKANAASVAIKKPLTNTPDEVWSYSSGTSNIISQIIKQSLEGSSEEYFNFPRKALFNKIGMTSAIIEPDPSGTFVGSSFMYATARDWARFGILFLNDGMWDTTRILPAGWVKYSTTPTTAAPTGEYGAHFWLNAGKPKGSTNRKWPKLPSDIFYAAGFEGQNIIIIPSLGLIVVRLGLTKNRAAWDIGAFVEEILKARTN